MPARNLGDDFVSSASLWIVNRLLPPLWDGPPPFRGGRATFNHPSMRWAPPSTRPASRVDSRRVKPSITARRRDARGNRRAQRD